MPISKRSIASAVFLVFAVIIAAYQYVAALPATGLDNENPSDGQVLESLRVDTDSEGDAVIETNALVTHVADGDTFDVLFDDGSEARIRMLGVNTPETVDPRRPVECFGQEASSFAKELLSDARVRLEADPEADERDKYGRLLRNVYLSDGTDFNALLIREGYAYAYLSFPQDAERKHELKELENNARDAGRGLWNPDACLSE